MRDVIEWQLDDVFDVNGWDVQKALRLLQSSNSTPMEWGIFHDSISHDRRLEENIRYPTDISGARRDFITT